MTLYRGNIKTSQSWHSNHDTPLAQVIWKWPCISLIQGHVNLGNVCWQCLLSSVLLFRIACAGGVSWLPCHDFVCLFVCEAATPLTLPKSWERIRVVRSSKVTVKFLARIGWHSRNGPGMIGLYLYCCTLLQRLLWHVPQTPRNVSMPGQYVPTRARAQHQWGEQTYYRPAKG